MAKKQNKKEERKRRLLLLILLFVLTLVIGGTATYAWFTSNRQVNVDPLDVNVSTANGLQISADAINWKARVTRSELNSVGGTGGTYTAATNQLPYIFGDVSTDGTVASGKMKMFDGSVQIDSVGGIDYLLTAAAAPTEIHCSGTGSETGQCPEANNYVAFDLFFKVDAQTDVVLTSNSNVVETEGHTDQRGIENTVRVAFIKLGYTNNPLNSSGAQGFSTASEKIFWEPNCNSHTPTGTNAATTIYGFSAAQAADGTGTCGLDYKGINSAITTGINVNTTGPNTSDSHFSSISADKFIKTQKTNTANNDIFTLLPGITKYRVYWWVEGQDVDTENNATNSYMTLNLEFAIKGQ